MNAIYAGSFDPFTNGHLHIVRQASEIFDRVYILIAANQDKKRQYPVVDMVYAISASLEGIDNVVIVPLFPDQFVADYAKENDIRYSVRGLRNDMDYQYEEMIAKNNREINPDLQTIYLRSDNEIISSSFVKMMFGAGKDISKYVPESIEKLMKGVKKS